jgi:transcription-repair coupling factor (superfamily II helicase)
MNLEIATPEKFFNGDQIGGIKAFKNFLEEKRKIIIKQGESRQKIIIACKSFGVFEGMKRLFDEFQINFIALNTMEDAKEISQKYVGLCIYDLQEGFETKNFLFIADEMIIGKALVNAKKKKALNIQKMKISLNQFEKGDLVVHTEFGVGLFDGVLTIDTSGLKCDVVKVLYQNNDALYVPIYNINQIKKYGGEVPEEERLSCLDKLGGISFKVRKAKAKSRIFEIAAKLMEVAGRRKLLQAPEITINEEKYGLFTAKFPYLPTEDQEIAINDCIADIQSGKPMDRLICGDVGFGKTEVAMRVSFLCAENGGQVAIVVPTTILARQHFNNFTKRFEGTGLVIRELSRNTTAKVKEEVIAELELGEAHILIGTHALFSEKLKFKNLNLIIIDEEQHFGVKQKEKLKEGREGIHFLSLSATPIPRTLQMSLSGLRDISVISTPPVDRLLPKTFLMPFDAIVLSSAITREKMRGGRTFFVCPRISDLEEQKAKLEVALPEVRFGIAHGRMTSNQIEDVMLAFYEGRLDVLVTTSIIESGIDISFANTIIIYRADMFGLSAIYQLRGRVGRGQEQSYAYLIADTAKMEDGSPAKNRLLAMTNIKSLGSGFKIAGTDMDIRGAGNLVGEEQSGKISGVGVELYEEMLAESIEKLKTGGLSQENSQESEDFNPEVKIGMAVLIPENYIPDFNLRLEFYRRISAVASLEELNGLSDEMADRFGALPEGAMNLINIVKLKIRCKKIGILRFEVGVKGAVIFVHEGTFNKGEALLSFAMKNPKLVKISPEKVNFFMEGANLGEKASKILSTFENF